MRAARRVRPRLPACRVVAEMLHFPTRAYRWRTDLLVLDTRLFGPIEHRLGAEQRPGRRSAAQKGGQEKRSQQEGQRSSQGARHRGVLPCSIPGAFVGVTQGTRSGSDGKTTAASASGSFFIIGRSRSRTFANVLSTGERPTGETLARVPQTSRAGRLFEAAARLQENDRCIYGSLRISPSDGGIAPRRLFMTGCANRFW